MNIADQQILDPSLAASDEMSTDMGSRAVPLR